MERSSCIVPFCRRWSTKFPGEWLCGEHWRGVDRALKRLRTKLHKRLDRVIETAQCAG
jgi:hypothetical protein